MWRLSLGPSFYPSPFWVSAVGCCVQKGTLYAGFLVLGEGCSCWSKAMDAGDPKPSPAPLPRCGFPRPRPPRGLAVPPLGHSLAHSAHPGLGSRGSLSEGQSGPCAAPLVLAATVPRGAFRGVGAWARGPARWAGTAAAWSSALNLPLWPQEGKARGRSPAPLMSPRGAEELGLCPFPCGPAP